MRILVSRYLSLFVFLLIPLLSQAQVNVLIGYKSGLGNFDLNNDLLSSYEPTSGELQKSFAPLHFIHGIQVGLRYKLGHLSLLGGWESAGRDRDALIFFPAVESFTSRTYKYSISGLFVGVESIYGSFGFGSQLMTKKFVVKRDLGDFNLDVMAQSRTHLQIEFIWMVQQSDRVSFSIKPYVEFSLKPYDFQNLANDLEILDAGSGFEDSIRIFGLSFVFYNGRHGTQ